MFSLVIPGYSKVLDVALVFTIPQPILYISHIEVHCIGPKGIFHLNQSLKLSTKINIQHDYDYIKSYGSLVTRLLLLMRKETRRCLVVLQSCHALLMIIQVLGCHIIYILCGIIAFLILYFLQIVCTTGILICGLQCILTVLHMEYCDFPRSCNKNRRCGLFVVAMTTFLTKFKMTSCEKLRSSAYSEDLRWRIVWQRYGLQLNILKIAENLSVDKSTVSRVLHTFCSTGLVSLKKAYPVHRARRKITLP